MSSTVDKTIVSDSNQCRMYSCLEIRAQNNLSVLMLCLRDAKGATDLLFCCGPVMAVCEMIDLKRERRVELIAEPDDLHPCRHPEKEAEEIDEK